MKRLKILSSIEDAALIKHYNEYAANFISNVYNINFDFTQKKKWFVVPVESGYVFYEEDIDSIIRAFKSKGCQNLIAIATEDLNFDLCYNVPVTKQAFFEFSGNFSSFNYLLFSEQCELSVLCCDDYVNFIIGPKELAEIALGCSIKEARQKLYAYADTYRGYSANSLNYILKIAKKYEYFNIAKQ